MKTLLTFLLLAVSATAQVPLIPDTTALKDTRTAANTSFAWITTALAGKQAALGFTPVPNTRTINGRALSADIVLDTSLIGENGKLYFTNTLARAAVSGSGIIQYDPATGIFSCPTCGSASGVPSVFGRTGNVTALVADYSAFYQLIITGAPTAWPSTFAPAPHFHDAGDVNAGIFNIARIPTGISGATVALGNHDHNSVYEPKITADVVTKYWSGTKTWRDFGTDVLAAAASALAAKQNTIAGAPSTWPAATAVVSVAVAPGDAVTTVPYGLTIADGAQATESCIDTGTGKKTYAWSYVDTASDLTRMKIYWNGTATFTGKCSATLGGLQGPAGPQGPPGGGDMYSSMYDAAGKHAQVLVTSDLDIDSTMAANSDLKAASQKAVKAALALKAALGASTQVNGQTCALGSTCAVDPAAKFQEVKVAGYEIGAEDATAVLVTTNLTAHDFAENGGYAKTITRATCWADNSAGQTVTVKVGATTKFTIVCTSTQSNTDGSAGVRTAGFASATLAAGDKLDLSGTANTTTKDIKLHIWGTVN